jgi:hypothetical protein
MRTTMVGACLNYGSVHLQSLMQYFPSHLRFILRLLEARLACPIYCPKLSHVLITQLLLQPVPSQRCAFQSGQLKHGNERVSAGLGQAGRLVRRVGDRVPTAGRQCARV